jgi:hypothetical protein
MPPSMSVCLRACVTEAHMTAWIPLTNGAQQSASASGVFSREIEIEWGSVEEVMLFKEISGISKTCHTSQSSPQ